MSETRVRHPILPEPKCGEPLRLKGFALGCDRPRDHLPTDSHASTVSWKAPIVRATEARP